MRGKKMIIRHVMLAGLVALSVGCKELRSEIPESDNLHTSVPVASGYDVLYQSPDAYQMTVGTWNEQARHFEEGVIFAEDLDHDGRFDRISILNVPSGHPLEDLTSVNKLQEIRDAVHNGN